MFDTLNYIELSGEKYPIKCDLLVLERLQEKFGDISSFERLILNWETEEDDDGNPILDKKGNKKVKAKLPDVKAVNHALYWMVQEGMEVEAELNNEPVKTLEWSNLIRLADLPYTELAKELHKEFAKCFESKNWKTT